MRVVGTVGPRVVVRPPNVPAPPPISLLTQGTTVEDDHDVIQAQGLQAQAGRWEAGGGTVWLDPLRQFSGIQVYQNWPDGGGAGSTDKLTLADGTEAAAASIDPALQSTIQRPMISAIELDQGVLTDYVEAHALQELPVEAQIIRALDAVIARVVERELWTNQTGDRANWLSQFRLKAPHVHTITNTATPFALAFALAEQAAADFRFLDQFGGSMIHVPLAMFSLITSRLGGIIRSPSGRQYTTPAGSMLVPELGATGTWTEAGTAFTNARPGGSPPGDNLATGWIFVTPPVRVRLGQGGTQVIESVVNTPTNDITYVGERAFTIESSIGSAANPTSIAIPVDYTTEF